MATRIKKGNTKEYVEKVFSGGTIRIYEGKKNDYGTISLDCGFAIRVQIIKSAKQPFIAYPSYRDSNNNYINQAFCFDSDVIEELSEIVEELY